MKKVESGAGEAGQKTVSLPIPPKKFHYYHKRYDLEWYLFTKIHRAVAERGYMKHKEFFLVVSWKMEAAKDIIRKNNPYLRREIEASTRDVLDDNITSTLRDKVKRLLKIKGVGVSLASAILAICFPERYMPLYHRSWRSLYRWSKVGELGQEWGAIKKETISAGREDAVQDYINYNRISSRLANHIFKEMSEKKRLRTLFRALSAYDLEIELRRFLRRVK